MLKGGKHRLSKVYLRFEKIDVNISIQANTESVKPVWPYFVSRACVWFVVARMVLLGVKANRIQIADRRVC